MLITPDSLYRVGDREDRISRERFRQIALERFAPEVLSERDPGEYYDAIIAQKDAAGRHADALFVLAMFEHESTYGKYGMASTTRSWGNTRPPSFGADEIGRAEQWIDGKLNGYFSMYGSWLDGVISTAMRLVHADAPYAGRTRIVEIFTHPSGRVWAPAGDHNNPTSYLGAIMLAMNRDGDRLHIARGIAKPTVITTLTTPNKGGYDQPRIVQAICKHISDGTQVGDLSWLMNPDSDAGVNYYINKDGLIWEMADPSWAAWTNGPRKKPNLNNPLIRSWHEAGINPNTRTVSVEHEGKPGDRLTAAQIASSAALDAWLSDLYSIPLNRTFVIGHYEIDSVDRWYCPSFDEDEWQAMFSAADAILNPNPPPAPQEEEWLETPGVGRFRIAGGFLAFWREHGGLDRDGWPLTNEFTDNGMTVQYFERSRYEWHPGAWPERYDTLRGRLGVEVLELSLENAALRSEIERVKATLHGN